MKKGFICSFLILSISLIPYSFAKCNGHHKGSHPHHYNHNNYHSSSGNSTPVYLVRSEQNETQEKFVNCEKHYLITKTTTNYYSDGSRRLFINSTIYDKDGAIIASDCNKVSHTIYKNNHYFIICKNKGGCSIIDSNGKTLTKRNYSRMEEIELNRILVKYDKKFGIIDLKENIIVPIKYQKFEKISDKTFITKLNGYYGILDTDNKILVKNDCEKIKPLHETILLKRYNKYGLANKEGKILFECQYDKIKKMGEYIVIKKDKKVKVLDYKGSELNGVNYRDIKLKRNTLYGKLDNKKFEIIENQ